METQTEEREEMRTQRVKEAVKKMLRSYRILIEGGGESEVTVWKHRYGRTYACALCMAVLGEGGVPGCRWCPLMDLGGGANVGSGCITGSMMRLKRALQEGEREEIVAVAKLRYQDLVGHLKGKGFDCD